jgi:nitrate reductase (cytochrome), electron transfer subunit
MRSMILAAFALVAASSIPASEHYPPGHMDRMRGTTPITQESSPPPLVNPDDSSVRRVRSYAMQPPVVPHKIEGYQVDINANRCMFCHARTRTEDSRAPMISVTHFMDRDGNFLAELSPRRYFCLQCHVPQVPVEARVQNNFVDVDVLLRRSGSPSATLREQGAP